MAVFSGQQQDTKPHLAAPAGHGAVMVEEDLVTSICDCVKLK